MEYFGDSCTFGILVYDLVNKTSFMEQSEHFHFWCLLLAYFCILAIVNNSDRDQNFFGKTIEQMQSEFVVVYSNFLVCDKTTFLGRLRP